MPVISALLLAALQTPTTPPTEVKVIAPMAQRMILEEKNQHPEIFKMGLHAVPLNSTDNVIIACNKPAKIGKPSKEGDLKIVAEGKPFAHRIDKEKVYELIFPLNDASGHSIEGGFLVLEVSFDNAKDEKEALKVGMPVRDEVVSHIPNRHALYQQ